MKKIFLSSATLLTALFLVNCGGSNKDPETSAPKVFNGKDSWDKSGVVKFDRQNCTGVLVAKNTILTAAHCFKNGSPQDYVGTPLYYEKNNKSYSIESLKIAPFHDKNSITVHPHDLNQVAFDLALVFFDDRGEIQDNDIHPIADRNSVSSLRKLRSSVTLKGYGLTNNNGNNPGAFAHTLQEGNSTFVSTWGLFDQEIYFWGPSNACVGDSGGPIFSGQKLLAITIKGTVFWDDSCNQEDLIGTNLTHGAVRQWLNEQSEGRLNL